MWSSILNWSLSFIQNLGKFSTWLFEPFLNRDNSLGIEVIYRTFGVDISVCPADLIATGLLTTVLILGMLHLVNFIAG